MKEDKALAKVTGGSKEIPSAKQHQYSQDPKDLCGFLEKGACLVHRRETTAPAAVQPRSQSQGGRNPKFPKQLFKKQFKQ